MAISDSIRDVVRKSAGKAIPTPKQDIQPINPNKGPLGNLKDKIGQQNPLNEMKKKLNSGMKPIGQPPQGYKDSLNKIKQGYQGAFPKSRDGSTVA